MIGIESNDAEAISLLEGVGERASDLSPLMAKLEPWMATHVRQHFDEEQGVTGTFDLLTELYEKQKQKKFPGRSILQASGTLYNSIAADHDAEMVEAGATDSEIFFHAGDHRAPGVPLRDPQFLAPDFENDLEQVSADFIETGVL